MESDAIIDVRFKTPEENGRQTAVTGDYYSCPFIVGGTAVAQLPSRTG